MAMSQAGQSISDFIFSNRFIDSEATLIPTRSCKRWHRNTYSSGLQTSCLLSVCDSNLNPPININNLGDKVSHAGVLFLSKAECTFVGLNLKHCYSYLRTHRTLHFSCLQC